MVKSETQGKLYTCKSTPTRFLSNAMIFRNDFDGRTKFDDAIEITARQTFPDSIDTRSNPGAVAKMSKRGGRGRNQFVVSQDDRIRVGER